jgi:hypothetical protein
MKEYDGYSFFVKRQIVCSLDLVEDEIQLTVHSSKKITGEEVYRFREWLIRTITRLFYDLDDK